jgi:hypothetical protein
VRGKNDGHGVKAAGDGYDGTVDQAQEDQARSAEMKKPAANDASGAKGLRALGGLCGVRGLNRSHQQIVEVPFHISIG